MTGAARFHPANLTAPETVMLEIDDESVGLLLPLDDGYQFEAAHPNLFGWHGHRFQSTVEAETMLTRALRHANDK